jgi:seryl-tRNA synthetase
MSVGLQRLREDADAIRKGAIDKGEDPALVDRRSSSTPRRARSSATATAQGRAQRRVEGDRRGDQGRRQPDGPEVAELRAAVDGRRRIAAIDTELADVEAQVEDLLLRIPNPPTPTSRSVARRPTSPSAPGASSSRDQPLDGESARAPAGPTWRRKPHWEIAEALDIIDLPRGAKIAGSGFPSTRAPGPRSSAR